MLVQIFVMCRRMVAIFFFGIVMPCGYFLRRIVITCESFPIRADFDKAREGYLNVAERVLNRSRIFINISVSVAEPTQQTRTPSPNPNSQTQRLLNFLVDQLKFFLIGCVGD